MTDRETRSIFIETGSGAPADWDVVLQGMLGFNRSKAGVAGEPLASLARDEDGQTLGGVVGFTQGGWLYVELFWLPEDLRGQGLGSALLADAEEEARNRGCTHAHLDAFTFQAPAFYERQGYKEFGRLLNYPTGHSRIFYQKAL